MCATIIPTVGEEKVSSCAFEIRLDIAVITHTTSGAVVTSEAMERAIEKVEAAGGSVAIGDVEEWDEREEE